MNNSNKEIKMKETKMVNTTKEKTKNKKQLRILSGITPSSSEGLHLGNYLGAVKPQIEFQERGECFYFMADYHALNVVHDGETFRKNLFETYVEYLAFGVDLEKTKFYVQSHVPEVFELTTILTNVITLAEMKRMHAFKDKLQDPDADINSINMGLFNYPILMGADILLYEPDVIPVGEDQQQHVETARDMARSFNKRYGKVMKEPKAYIREEVARVVGIDGERKMSKSLGNVIPIFGSEDEIKKRIMSITTDPNRIKKDDPGDPDKNPIFSYMLHMGYEKAEYDDFVKRYKAGTIGDVELKNIFYEYFMDYFADIRAKRDEFASDPDKIYEIMRDGRDRVQPIAKENLEKIREVIGYLKV